MPARRSLTRQPVARGMEVWVVAAVVSRVWIVSPTRDSGRLLSVTADIVAGYVLHRLTSGNDTWRELKFLVQKIDFCRKWVDETELDST